MTDRPASPPDHHAGHAGSNGRSRGAPGRARHGRAYRSMTAGLGLAGAGVLAAACGGVASRSSSPLARPAAPKATVASSPPVTVGAAGVAGLGTVLVDSRGRTLYLLSADKQQGPTCTGSNGCTQYWPPLLAQGRPNPVAGPGVTASLLGTTAAGDGSRQVTYNHWPLYTFAGDVGTQHQAKGQGIHSFGGTWAAVTVSGQAAGSSQSVFPRSATTTAPGRY